MNAKDKKEIAKICDKMNVKIDDLIKALASVDNNYLVQPDYVMEREANYKLLDIVESFEFCPEYYEDENGGHGNLCGSLCINRKTLRASFSKDYYEKVYCENSTHASFQEAISSALLMYRLSCLFKGQAMFEGQDTYKFTWQFALKHKKTGEVICFGEWKGGSLFWTQGDNSKEFKKDVAKLVNAIVSRKCPHPYDGLVAGSVA